MIYIKWWSNLVLFSYKYQKIIESFSLYDSLSPPAFYILWIHHVEMFCSLWHWTAQENWFSYFRKCPGALQWWAQMLQHSFSKMSLRGLLLPHILEILQDFFRWFCKTFTIYFSVWQPPWPQFVSVQPLNTSALTWRSGHVSYRVLSVGSSFTSKCKEVLWCLRYYCRNCW